MKKKSAFRRVSAEEVGNMLAEGEGGYDWRGLPLKRIWASQTGAGYYVVFQGLL